MRVIHVTTVPQSLGFLRGQTAFMRTRGFELSFVSAPGDALERFAATEEARVFAVPMERRITPLRDLAALRRLWAHFRRERPDVVHAHTPKGGLLGTIAAALAGVPVRIYHMRGLPLMGASGARRTLLTLTEMVSCGLATEVLCVSHSLRGVALDLGLTDPDKIQVLLRGSGQGVDTEGRFNPATHAAQRERVRHSWGVPSSGLVFGFVGRIVRDKGVHELARAWARIRDAHPHAHLVIVGPFEDQDPVDDAVREALRSDERAHLVGSSDDPARLYAAMDVVVLPTYREGFPNVPLEAMSMALPVIATRIPGCVDAVEDGVTGILVPPKTVTPLFEAMDRYARSEALRREHGHSGRMRAREFFRRERIWQALSEAYEAALRLPVHPGGEQRRRAEVSRG
ncbi:MAG: glycosyltransferase family 1 protein [Sandaracinaceae bacterium]|nr:MAG: glycosyltransferase family 1 protein [Sandaracinaceae bacterium]